MLPILWEGKLRNHRKKSNILYLLLSPFTTFLLIKTREITERNFLKFYIIFPA